MKRFFLTLAILPALSACGGEPIKPAHVEWFRDYYRDRHDETYRIHDEPGLYGNVEITQPNAHSIDIIIRAPDERVEQFRKNAKKNQRDFVYADFCPFEFEEIWGMLDPSNKVMLRIVEEEAGGLFYKYSCSDRAIKAQELSAEERKWALQRFENAWRGERWRKKR